MNLEAILPNFCHDWRMGQLLLHRTHGLVPGEATRSRPARATPDPGAPARGILLALALSALFWVGLALAVPLAW